MHSVKLGLLVVQALPVGDDVLQRELDVVAPEKSDGVDGEVWAPTLPANVLEEPLRSFAVPLAQDQQAARTPYPADTSVEFPRVSWTKQGSAPIGPIDRRFCLFVRHGMASSVHASRAD